MRLTAECAIRRAEHASSGILRKPIRCTIKHQAHLTLSAPSRRPGTLLSSTSLSWRDIMRRHEEAVAVQDRQCVQDDPDVHR